MENIQKLSKITAELLNQAQNLQCLAKELSKLINEGNGHGGLAGPVSNILPFPCGNERRLNKASFPSGSLSAMPGKPLPDGLTDYRPLLQRDGLLLLSWDKRITEMGERYTAYWVTSAGKARFYASRSLALEDFPFARPDHKSYAAEDGIEFYGQEAPLYLVHVAPELMMNNPWHGELRLAHIQTLKEQGSTVDFEYKYLLKTEKEKNREASRKKTKGINQHRAG